MNRKKVTAVLSAAISVVILFSLAACNASQEVPKGSETADSTPETSASTPETSAQEVPVSVSKAGMFNVLDYGADPTGTKDSTDAIQKAIDAAYEYNNPYAWEVEESGQEKIDPEGQGGTVIIPSGIYLCSDLKMHSMVRLQGYSTWGYKADGSCILKLNNDAAVCLIDLTNTVYSTISDLSIDGSNLGTEIHGIYLNTEKGLGSEAGHKYEDGPTLNNVRVDAFSGDAVHYRNIWNFRIFDCQLRGSRNGLWLHGVDGFISNCWFSSNREWGIYSDPDGYNCAAHILTGCRIEHNKAGGYYITAANKWQIDANNFDRNYGPAIYVTSNGHRRCPHSYAVSITDCCFNRNGYMGDGDSAKTNPDERDMCHIRLEDCYDVVVSGNTFLADGNDSHQGNVSPRYCFVTESLKNVIISSNAVQNGSTDKILYDLGNHYIEKGTAEGTTGADGVEYEASEEYGVNYGLLYTDNVGGIANSDCYMQGGFFVSSLGNGSLLNAQYVFKDAEGDIIQLFENGDASISLDSEDPSRFTSLTADWSYDSDADKYIVKIKGGRGFYKETFSVGTTLESIKNDDKYEFIMSDPQASFNRTFSRQ